MAKCTVLTTYSTAFAVLSRKLSDSEVRCRELETDNERLHLVAAAEELFLELDAREAADGQS